jgi:hypothetical protein
MVAEEHVLSAGHVVDAVLELARRSHRLGIELEDVAGDALGVEMVAEQINSQTDERRDGADQYFLAYSRSKRTVWQRGQPASL